MQEQAGLVASLREQGLEPQAAELASLYAAQQKSLLCADVYEAAKGQGEPPHGWTRGSTDPEALRAAGFELSDSEIADLLRPEGSAFRAEIYLPDKAIHGPDAKPVVVFKGSAGEILDPAAPGGLRDTTAEDFGNNTLQGLGLRSDIYDRAMRLGARLMEVAPGRFEVAGHSLGGGLAAAAAAVTGVQATVFNPAGLHPNTALRFTQENGLPLHDAQALVSGYEVKHDILNTLQNAVERMPEDSRDEVEPVLRMLAGMASEPNARELLVKTLGQSMSEREVGMYLQAFDHLAGPEGQGALARLPGAVGQMQVLAAFQRNPVSQQLEAQPAGDSLSESVARAAPWLPALREGVSTAGKTVGIGLALGSYVSSANHAQANAVDVAREAVDAGFGFQRTILEEARDGMGWVFGRAASPGTAESVFVPGGVAWAAGPGLLEQARELSERVRNGVNDGLTAYADKLRSVGDRAEVALPLLSAGVPAATVAATSKVVDDNMHYSPAVAAYGLVSNGFQAKELYGAISLSAGRAEFAHSQKDSVVPSMEVMVHNTEQRAYAELAIARGREDGPLDNYRIDQPGHEGNGLFVMAQAGVHKLDQQCGVVSDVHSDQLAGVVAAQAYKDGLTRIERLSLSVDCSRVIAEDFAGPGIEYQKRSAVDVVQGRSTPLEHSTTAWEEQADRQQRGQALEQVQAAPVQAEGMSR
ncbi:hypothetical protein H4O09_01855 [Stenotrophomonas sp. W1S232]|uniref:X-Tfes XVIPCD domain-containing protein n=1 Tax=Stenotrophomonas koreensis TaxID=266128 RepID=A0A7W3UXR0_9GAMM|nr:XVIPCD domain-containing protein [Stenotrophomonas koreensis]MBB1115810.1 hypothetical protein [Stenotrophomonas koreensis]